MMRAMAAILVRVPLVAAVLVASVGTIGVGAQSQEATPSGTPAVVGGDELTRLVPAAPDASVLYAVGDDGFYRSEDAGASWDRVGPGPPDALIVAAPDDPALLLAGDRPPCGRGDGEEPMERSTDGGATWRVTGALGLQPVAIVGDGEAAYAVGCAGLFASTDRGVSWRPTFAELGFEVTALAPLPASGEATEALMVTTSEGGTSRLFRIDLANPDPAALAQVPLTEFWGLGEPVGRDAVYAVGTARGVLVSTDGGTTWTLARAGLEAVTLSVDPTLELIPEAEQARGFGVNVVAIDPDEPSRLYAGTVDGLFVSGDTGANWAPVPQVAGGVTALVLLPASGRLLAETDGGVVAVALPQ